MLLSCRIPQLGWPGAPSAWLAWTSVEFREPSQAGCGIRQDSNIIYGYWAILRLYEPQFRIPPTWTSRRQARPWFWGPRWSSARSKTAGTTRGRTTSSSSGRCVNCERVALTIEVGSWKELGTWKERIRESSMKFQILAIFYKNIVFVVDNREMGQCSGNILHNL